MSADLIFAVIPILLLTRRFGLEMKRLAIKLTLGL
jgi:hypothetical protein